MITDKDDLIVWPPESDEVSDDNENENSKDDETGSITGAAGLDFTAESE